MSAKVITGCPPAQPIKRFLRHRASLAYFKDDGWTTKPEEARSFSDVVEAAEACAQYGLKDVELALRYEAGAEDLFCTPIR